MIIRIVYRTVGRVLISRRKCRKECVIELHWNA
nr:MAG TPA: hypothetical protein [Caudoviricetes sp.]